MQVARLPKSYLYHVNDNYMQYNLSLIENVPYISFGRLYVCTQCYLGSLVFFIFPVATRNDIYTVLKFLLV